MKTPNPRICSRRGMALIEMMLAVVLMAAFGLVSAKLFHAVSHITADARPTPMPDRDVMRALKELRSDVWNAMELKVLNDKTLRIVRGGGQTVEWTLGVEGMTRRVTLRDKVQPPAAFPLVGGPSGFEPLPGGVRVGMPEKHTRGHEQMFSQLQLLKGGGR